MSWIDITGALFAGAVCAAIGYWFGYWHGRYVALFDQLTNKQRKSTQG